MRRPPLTPHAKAWLLKHPDRTEQWLRERFKEGFEVHHINGNHSDNHPENLVLIERNDHMRLHGMFGIRAFNREQKAAAGRLGGLKSAEARKRKQERSEIYRRNALKRSGQGNGSPALCGPTSDREER